MPGVGPSIEEIAVGQRVEIPAVAQSAAPDVAGHERAVQLLTGSIASYVGAWLAFVLALSTMFLTLSLFNPADAADASASEGNSSTESLSLGAVCAYGHVATLRLYAYTTFIFATAQTQSLAKTTRDRFTTTLPNLPNGAGWLRGTTAWFGAVLVFFLLSIGMALHAIVELVLALGGGYDEVVALSLCLMFLVCSSSWLAKATRDRTDAAMWQAEPNHTGAVLTLARGTAANVVLCFGSWVLSVVLTIVTVLQSDEAGFEWSLKMLIIMGECFQVASAFYLAKTIRDSKDPAFNVAPRDWALAGGAFLVAVLMTYISLGAAGLSSNLTISIYTGLVFSLFSTFFYAKLVRDHKELKVSIWGTLCGNACVQGTALHSVSVTSH